MDALVDLPEFFVRPAHCTTPKVAKPTPETPVVSYKKARELRLKYYFTAELCKRGHLDFRMTINSTCMSCGRLAAKTAYAANPRKFIERSLAAARKDPESHKARVRRRWAALPFEIRTQQLRDAAYKRDTNPEIAARYRACLKAQKARRRAREKDSVSTLTGAEIKAIYVLQGGKCADCKRRLGKSYHADHIMPLARGGATDRRNTQVLCSRCNLRKGAKLPHEWALELGRLL